jgi:hypothetical protein
MLSKRLLSLATAVLGVFLWAAVPANASTLIGDSLTVTYYFPDTSTIFTADGGFPQTFAAGSGSVTDSFLGGPFFTVSAGASDIVISMLQGQQYPDGGSPVFDGIGVSGIVPTIIGATAGGIDPSRITFDGHDVFFNFANLTFNGGDQPTVTLEFAEAVPEPSTWVMMIFGFAGIGFTAYRGKSKPALMDA